jgi:hypothetical protein
LFVVLYALGKASQGNDFHIEANHEDC